MLTGEFNFEILHKPFVVINTYAQLVDIYLLKKLVHIYTQLVDIYQLKKTS